MEKIVIAVGSTRRPKLGAVSEALKTIGSNLDPGAEFEIVGVEAPSGVSHTPLTRNEIMEGARNRAHALLEMSRARQEWRHYFVGLEGGLDVIEQRGERFVFLENWAYVLNSQGRGAFGQSGSVLLPPELVRSVVDDGIELGEAIDSFAGDRGIRDAQGAWGVLTKNAITRQDAFRVALINAFAPFYNAALYAQRRETGFN